MEEKHEEHKKEEHKHKFNLKLSKWDILSIIALTIFLIIVISPTYYTGDCEVARPNNKCIMFKDALIENCIFWGNYGCESSADVSLPQVEWYIKNLCENQNKYHGAGLDCSNLKSTCNKLTGNQTCPTGYLG